jgi:hypothetical protein
MSGDGHHTQANDTDAGQVALILRRWRRLHGCQVFGFDVRSHRRNFFRRRGFFVGTLGGRTSLARP